MSDASAESIQSFLRHLSGDSGAPGAGAAGAVALALGAGCARKAAVLSAKRAPDDPVLRQAAEELERCMERALELGAEDGRCLDAHLAERSSETTEAIELCGQALLALATRIDGQVTALQGRVSAALAADLVAATALVAAARVVQNRNLDETQPPLPTELGAEAFQQQLRDSGWTAPALARELDVDVAMLDAWCEGREKPPRAVAFAIAELVARNRPRAVAAEVAAAAPVIGGAHGT